MAKKKVKRKPTKAKAKPREKKDFAQNALSIVERLIGGKLKPKQSRR